MARTLPDLYAGWRTTALGAITERRRDGVWEVTRPELLLRTDVEYRHGATANPRHQRVTIDRLHVRVCSRACPAEHGVLFTSRRVGLLWFGGAAGRPLTRTVTAPGQNAITPMTRGAP